MEKFARWTANHGWLFWIGLIIVGSLPGSIPGVGPFLFLAVCGTGIWWQIQARKGNPRPIVVGPAGSDDADPSGIRVVGTDHYKGWGRTRGLGRVELVREPQNTHDANAVAVLHGRNQIGHLPRETAALLAPLLDRAGHARLETTAHFDAAQVIVSLPQQAQLGLDPRALGLQPLEPWGRCENEVEIDYEADHRQEVAAVFHHRGVHLTTEGTVLRGVAAMIVPSEHPDAPAVLIDGQWVGNVTRARSAALPGVVRQLAGHNQALLVDANVWARNDRGIVRANVRLRLPALDEVRAPGPMPAGAHILLPRGSKIQVTGEERHLSEVSALLEGNAEQPVAATLHLVPPTTARSTRELIEVRIHDEKVGQLTAHMSEQFSALVKACAEEGITVVSHAKVKGNQLKADVELDSVKAGELSDEWISQHVYGMGRFTS